MQKYTSANTSLNQIPALFRKVSKYMDGYNFDNGAGRYNKATEYLKSLGITNMPYDKYNRGKEENSKALTHVNYETSTIANVLNVIDNEQDIINVLELSYTLLKDGGKCFISCYEGNKTGIGRKTKEDCYQQNKPLKWYLPLVKKVFPIAYIKYGIIIAEKEDL